MLFDFTPTENTKPANSEENLQDTEVQKTPVTPNSKRKGSFNTPRKVGIRKLSDHTYDKEILSLEPELKVIEELTIEGRQPLVKALSDICKIIFVAEEMTKYQAKIFRQFVTE